MDENTFVCDLQSGAVPGTGNSKGMSGSDSVNSQWSKGKITHEHRHQGGLCQGHAEAGPGSHKAVTGDNFSMLIFNLSQIRD